MRLEPDRAEYYCLLASSHLRAGKEPEGLQAAERALQLDPNSADAHFCLGCALHEPETLERAVTEYEESLKLVPEQFEVLGNLGDAYLKLGRAKDARNALTQAGKIKSNDPKLHHLLGKVYLALGDQGNASSEYKILKEQDASLAEDLEKLINPQT